MPLSLSRDTRPDYFRSLAEAIRDPDELISFLELPDCLREPARRAAKSFPLLVPKSFLARMTPGDPEDPLLRQVLPIGAEDEVVAGFTIDAVGDLDARKAPGLIHKYHGRALLIAAGSCAIHCRYCFRRHYPYHDDPRRIDDWEPALAAVREDHTLSEIILSGGDPLMLTDSRLRMLVERLEEVPHLTRLRIHSRLPIVLPDRVTDELLTTLCSTRLATVVVVHANHPSEIVGDCSEALLKLSSAHRGVHLGRPITVLNQTVLLRGVNDDVTSLSLLSERLFEVGVLPYYLHQLDRVAGAAHFEVSEEIGRALIGGMQERLPGYLVPKYVRETKGAVGKTSIS